MIKIWQFLWHGCWHHWKFIGKGALTLHGEVVGDYLRYQCDKCQRMEDRW
jgi:hypothetical protein